MPKKTKKQKILANIHRKLQYSSNLNLQEVNSGLNSVKSQNNSVIQNKSPEYAMTFNHAKETVMKINNTKAGSSYDYVKKDLVKITIFTIFALASQCVLYFLLRSR